MSAWVDGVEVRLAAAADALHKYELTALRGADLQHRMAELQTELDSLRAKHATELEEVERRDGLPLTRMLVSLLGGRDDGVAPERADAYAACYRVRVAGAYLQAVRREYEAVQARLAQLAGAAAAYVAVLDEKERKLGESGDPRRTRLLELADERGRLTGELHEIGEALRTAGIAQEALERVRARLTGVSRWSTPYDWSSEPGSGAAVDSGLEQVAAAAAYADRCLAGLRIELAYVGGVLPRGLWPAIERTTRFFELWLDGGFTRLAVRDQITRAQHHVERSMRQVGDVHRRLEQRAVDARTRLDQIDAERHILRTEQ
jgi:hypothetical protein